MSNLIQKNKIFRNTFFLIILAEILSFLGYYYPSFNIWCFFLIIILTLTASLYDLKYGLFIFLAELFIGSFGYLFYYNLGSSTISIREALWLIIMSVWLAKIILLWIKTKKISIIFFTSRYFSYFFVLGIFVIWGVVNGWLNGNASSNIILDFDRWLYFLMIFPIFQVLPTSQNIKIVKRVFLAAITWLSFKTIILEYFFSHNFSNFTLDLYRWVRNSGVGEVTQVQAGFSRIFIQSHIFVLIGFFIILFYLLKLMAAKTSGAGNKKISAHITNNFSLNNKILYTLYFILLTLFLSAIIISFSRSFWLGLFAGACLVWLIALFKYKIKFNKFITYNSLILLSILLSLILTLTVIKFFYPSPYGGFDPASLLEQRATQVSDEAGAVSRWQLLTPLWQKIKSAPFLGRGFGATVTYKSADPRVISSNPGGLYTTYAFEWGWLDVWLKLGLFGLLAYLALFVRIIIDGIRTSSYLAASLSVGLVVLMTVNIFSPYVNHPLGIGYIVITACLVDFIKKIKNK